MAATIAEEFFNDSQLFVAIPKSFLTGFHSPEDVGVEYGDSTVKVDGNLFLVRIYGEMIRATANFKYLWVHIDEYGSNKVHMQEKQIQRAFHMLLSSLIRVPVSFFDFMLDLWSMLVIPVVCYGFEVFEWTETDGKALQKHKIRHGATSCK